MSSDHVYRITFLHQGQVYEIYAGQISQGALFGFIEVEDLLFGERSQIVVDPSEERLKKEFEGVKRTYVPMHAILRIDEVDKQGAGRILPTPDKEGTLTHFPVPIYPPRDSKK